MCKIPTRCENWDEILNLIVQLTNENEQLRAEKQQLINEKMNLKFQLEQSERRRKLAYGTLISEMGDKYGNVREV